MRSYHQVIEANRPWLKTVGLGYWILLSISTTLWIIFISYILVKYETKRRNAIRAKEIEGYAMEAVSCAQEEETDAAIENFIGDLYRNFCVEDPVQDTRTPLLMGSGLTGGGRREGGYGAIEVSA
jgi:hypothetical protein